MRIILFSLLLVLGLSSSTFSQEVHKVEYTFLLNLQDYEEGIPYNSVLYYSEHESLFVFNYIELEETESFKKFVKDKSGKSDGVSIFRYFDKKGNWTYWNKKTGEMISRDLLGGNYPVQVNENSPNFGWKITDSTKIINGYKCHKAISTNFRGRIYTAWFTYEIPVPFGPWKINDLPGLILEVYDEQKLLHITLKENEHPRIDDNMKIVVPSESQIMNPDEFMEINYQWYLNNLNGKNMLDPIRKITPLSYSSIEYSIDQQSLINANKTIEYKEDF